MGRPGRALDDLDARSAEPSTGQVRVDQSRAVSRARAWSRGRSARSSMSRGGHLALDDGVHVPRRSARRRRPAGPARAATTQDLTPSATCRVEAVISSVVMPRPSFSPKVRLRDSGEEQVATRSPRPASPISVIGSAPSAVAEPGGLGEPAGDHRGGGVVAEAEADGHADAQADDVLVGAAELAADHVGAGVRPERRASGTAPCSRLATSSSAQATTLAAGSRLAISLARLGPLTTRDPLRAGAGDLGDHLAHPLEGAELDALHQRDQHRVARDDVGPLGEVGAQRLRRHGEHDELGAVAAPAPGRGWRVIASGSSMPGR